MVIIKTPIINIKKTHTRHRIFVRMGKVKANNKDTIPSLFFFIFFCSAVGEGADKSICKAICDGRL